MGQTTLNVRMDEETKHSFDAFCTNIGLTASAAVNLFVKTVIREHRIPFEITDRPNGETIAAIEEMEWEMRSGNYKRYADVNEMMRDILE